MQPTAIGPYSVVRLLGQGGMGAVYEVRHPEFPRALALKVLKNDVSHDAWARFRREAELLGRIRHPGVVAVHTLGQTSTGDPYLVTDLVAGQELSELTKRQRLEPRRCAELVRDLAAALEVVHAAGVIHRDLKPANVIVTPAGDPVLLDFGIARGAGVETLTQTGAVVGTVHYMSPEQADATGVVDARTDVYSLGAVLFFLLTGLPPYRGSSVEVLAALLHPSRQVPDPRQEAPEVPAPLAELCRRALARSPQDRTPTAGALRAELEAWLAQDSAPPSPPRGSLVAAALGLLALGLTVGGLAAWALGEPPPAAAASRAATPATSPASPTSSPSAPSSSPVDLEADEAGRALARLEGIWQRSLDRPQERGPEPRDRPSPDPTFPEDTLLAELEEWLAAHAAHPGAGHARQLLEAARRQLPLRVLDHGPVGHSTKSSFHFFRSGGQERLLSRTWMRPDLALWETGSWRAQPLLSLTQPGERPYHDRPEVSLLLPPSQGRGWRVVLGGRFGLPPRGGVERGVLLEVDLESGALRKLPLPPAARRVVSLALGPDARLAVGTARYTRRGQLLDPGSVHVLGPGGEVVRSWELGNSVADLAWLEGGLLVACLRGDEAEGTSTLLRWRQDQATPERLPLPLRTSGFGLTAREVLLGGVEGELVSLPLSGPWALRPNPPRRSGPGVKVAPLSAFAARGEVLFAGYGGEEPRTPPGTRELVLWRRTSQGYVQARRIPRPTPVLTLQLSPEGRYLAARGRRNRIEIWDAQALAER